MCVVFYIDFKKKVLLEKKVTEDSSKVISNDKEKLNHFSKMIKDGLTQVLVNGYVDGVSLPKNMIKNYAIPINWSIKFNLKDFAYDARGVSGTLSFSKKPFIVVLPWSSIWLIHHPDSPKSSKIWKSEVPSNFDVSQFLNNDR